MCLLFPNTIIVITNKIVIIKAKLSDPWSFSVAEHCFEGIRYLVKKKVIYFSKKHKTVVNPSLYQYPGNLMEIISIVTN